MALKWIQSATVEVNEKTGALLVEAATGFALADGSATQKVSPVTFSASTTLKWPDNAVALHLNVKSGSVQLQQTINGSPASITLPQAQWIGIPGQPSDLTTLAPTGSSTVEFVFEILGKSAN